MRFAFADAGSSRLGVQTTSAACVTGILIGATAGFFLRPVIQRLRRRLALGEIETDDDEEDEGCGYGGGGEEYKLVLCVRKDLGMSKGKVAAQAGHATLGAYKTARRMKPGAVARWTAGAQAKIALAIKGKGEADRLERAARARGLPTYKVFDAGRTQIAAGSMTVLAVGPASVSDVNSITGHLSLL